MILDEYARRHYRGRYMITGKRIQFWGLVATCVVPAVHAICGGTDILIETTGPGLSILSGCYNVSSYAGLYQTTVFTIEGKDFSEEGSPTILADLINGTDADPTWVIGIAVPLPANSWSDGYSAGLDVVNLLCIGDAKFWETADPTDVQSWRCDIDGDGSFTFTESGDFERVICGCSSQADDDNRQTPSPTIIEVIVNTPSPVVTIIPDQSTSAPDIAIPLTEAPVVTSDDIPGATFQPSSPGAMTESALACNLTITSETLVDVAGCFMGRPSSNGRGRWGQLDGSANIEWQPDEGGWIIALANSSGGTGETRCISQNDTDDPSTIERGLWRCDINRDGLFTARERGDFEGLDCREEACTQIDVAAAGDVSRSEESRDMIVIVASAMGALMLGGLLAFVCVITKRNKGVTIVQAQAAHANGGSLSETTNVEIPVFQPWGTRDPPRYHA